MKKFSFVLIALAVALATAPAALANTFDYTLTYGGVTATGILSGPLVSPGVYDITSGTINLTGSTINGTGVLVPIPASGVFQTGGGTELFPFNGCDIFLYPYLNPQINDINGAFLFDITSGPGSGNGVYIGSPGPGNYQVWGGNWAITGLGGGASFDATPTVTATPEPASLLLFGTGLAGVLGAVRRKLLC